MGRGGMEVTYGDGGHLWGWRGWGARVGLEGTCRVGGGTGMCGAERAIGRVWGWGGMKEAGGFMWGWRDPWGRCGAGGGSLGYM